MRFLLLFLFAFCFLAVARDSSRDSPKTSLQKRDLNSVFRKILRSRMIRAPRVGLKKGTRWLLTKMTPDDVIVSVYFFAVGFVINQLIFYLTKTYTPVDKEFDNEPSGTLTEVKKDE